MMKHKGRPVTYICMACGNIDPNAFGDVSCYLNRVMVYSDTLENTGGLPIKAEAVVIDGHFIRDPREVTITNTGNIEKK